MKPNPKFIEFMEKLLMDISKGLYQKRGWEANMLKQPLPQKLPLSIMFVQIIMEIPVGPDLEVYADAMPLVGVIPLCLLSQGWFCKKREAVFADFVNCNGAN